MARKMQTVLPTRTAVWMIAVCGVVSAAAGHEPKYDFTPIPAAAGSAATRHGTNINGSGQVAGSLNVSNSHVFVHTAEWGTIDTNPPGTIASWLRDFNDAGQALAEACIPPPGGNGPCGGFLYRHTPGVGNLRLDGMPGGPPAGASIFRPMAMNGAGSVALTFRSLDIGTTTESAYLYTDALGWQDLTPLLPPNSIFAEIVGIDDAGRVLIRSGAGTSMFLYTPGSGMAPVATGLYADDFNNALQMVGSALVGGVHRVYRFPIGGQIELIDPPGFAASGTQQVLNDAGMVAGLRPEGFFLYTDQDGFTDLGLANEGASIAAATINGLNMRGEFTGLEFDTTDYTPKPVIKKDGQPLKTVQEEIDPHVETIVVTGVSSINDSGQFVVSGLAPDMVTALSFIVTPRPCEADFNGSGGVSVQDLFDFIGAYFAGDDRADVNDSGLVSVQDVFDYLTMYFVGCD